MAGPRRREPGGIAGLLDLIEEHRSAFEYDWRSRFGLPLRSVFRGEMTWREALALTRELYRDPASHVSAAVAEWAHPMSREAFVLADVYDVMAKANFKNTRPYPRPTNQPKRSQRPRHSQATIRAALAARGHGMN